MDTHTQVREAMRALGQANWHKLSKQSGVAYGTLYKVGYGYVENPRWSTIDKLARVLLPKRKAAKS